MKKILLFLLVVGFLTPLASFSKAKMPSNTVEVILMVPEAENGRNIADITNTLNSAGGVQVVGYCNSQKCFYLQVNRFIQQDNNGILRLIINMGYHPEIKVNGTIAEAQDNCQG